MAGLNIRKWIQGYSRQAFTGDLTAGLIVGIVALPLCIAFAIASGLTPEKGLLTGAIGGLLVALFSGCPVQIAGPSGPFVVIALGIVQQFGLNGLMIATFSAGVMLIIMGRVGLGALIKFIPYPVIAGFTSGVALLLVTTEFKDLAGLHVASAGPSVVDKWIAYGGALDTVNLYAVAISAGTILLSVLQPKLLRRVPGTLVALIAATVVTSLFSLPVETIGSRFGEIPSGLPKVMFPKLSFDAVRDMVQPATAIGLLAAIEALLAAVVADGMTGKTHAPNRVLVSNGLANIGASFFGGLPACAAIARTATNVRNGARSRVAGVVHSLLLLLVMLFLGQWASLIPLASLAAILVVVAYNLLDWRSLAAMMHNPKSDIAVLFTTLGLTVLVDLPTGVEIGMILAAAMFIKRMATVTEVQRVTKELTREVSPSALVTPTALPPGVEIYEINGPFFFGVVYKLREAMNVVRRKPKVRMIRMANVSVMDSTGLHALEDVHRLCRKEGSTLIISEIHAQPFTSLLKSGLLEKFGEENVLASFDEAMARAAELVEPRS